MSFLGSVNYNRIVASLLLFVLFCSLPFLSFPALSLLPSFLPLSFCFERREIRPRGWKVRFYKPGSGEGERRKLKKKGSWPESKNSLFLLFAFLHCRS